MQSTANLPVIGLDLAKSVFQLHIVDEETGEIQRRQIKRAKLTEFFAKCQRSLVAMEACGTSHHWARVIRSFGHEVKLLPAQHVKAFLLRDKTDAMGMRRRFGSQPSSPISSPSPSRRSGNKPAWPCTACAASS